MKNVTVQGQVRKDNLFIRRVRPASTMTKTYRSPKTKPASIGEAARSFQRKVEREEAVTKRVEEFRRDHATITQQDLAKTCTV